MIGHCCAPAGEPCKFCTPCDCSCHRTEGMFHCMPCCGFCTECGQGERRQFSSSTPPREVTPCSG